MLTDVDTFATALHVKIEATRGCSPEPPPGEPALIRDHDRRQDYAQREARQLAATC